MKKSFPVDKLRIGMYVILPLSWTQHDFLRSAFKVSSSEQIAKIRSYGLREVEVDLAKSEVAAEVAAPAPQTLHELEYVSHNDTPADPKDQAPPPSWNPETLVPLELREAIADNKMAPERKAKAVYEHSREMMTRLLDVPTAENIQAGKAAVRDISDLILSDDATARTLLRITAHDFYTYTHSVNVGFTALMLAKEIFKGSEGHDMHELGAGFFLHDLGKIKVDPAIINKPARLDEDEMRRMRIHPYQGYKLLRDADALSEECRTIIMEHHELYDGSGYPKRIGGDQIHVYGRICCIADVFDALTAERSYKQSMKPFDALTLMRDKMPNHFDKQLFTRFVRLFQ